MTLQTSGSPAAEDIKAAPPNSGMQIAPSELRGVAKRKVDIIMEIRRIDSAHGADARLANEPFTLWGRMIPALRDGVWSYSVSHFEVPGEECYPAEDYDVDSDDGIFLGAYDGDRCVGLAVLRREMFRYLYLDDLKVCKAYRGLGIGGLLVEAAMAEAARLKLVGVYAIAQDDNLSACLFYLKQGFAIGGFDNRAYRGTMQAHRANIFFYRDCENPSGRKGRAPDTADRAHDGV